MKPSNVITEVFNGTSWSTLEPYPFEIAINSYGVVSLPDQVVLFGGRNTNGNTGSEIIASFKATVSWSPSFRTHKACRRS